MIHNRLFELINQSLTENGHSFTTTTLWPRPHVYVFIAFPYCFR